MFATLLGALPRPAIDGGGASPSEDELVTAAIAAQEAAGLEPVTDGRLRGDLATLALGSASVVPAWEFAARVTPRAVKQALPGPYSSGRRVVAAATDASSRGVPHGATATKASTREAVLESADRLRATVEALAVAGCPMVEIEEWDAHLIGSDQAERELFRDAHRRLTEGIAGTHLSLSIVGGSAWSAGIETILDAPYASLAVDLIDGPDNWNLVTRLPGDRGVIAGALPGKASPADAKEMLVWAARYAAASRGRGLERVGIGSAGSWAVLTWAAAVEKMERLGQAARLASSTDKQRLARELDPRAVSARSAALGHVAPPKESGSRGGTD
jgi:methionine synthase II (cobalamin-independent)